MKSRKNSKLDYFVLGMFCVLVLKMASGALNKEGKVVESKKVTVQQQDLDAWRDTLFVLSVRPSEMSDGDDVIFTNRRGIKQMVRGMKDNVVPVQYGDIVVINEDCNVIELLKRKQHINTFVKQK